MVTLGDLRRSLLATATDLVPPTDADDATVVSWVRVLRARTPALDVLEAGDLVIVPMAALAVVAPGPSEAASLADALARPPAAGVVVTGEAGDGPTDGGSMAVVTLGEALARVGLPAVRIGPTDPAALERRIIGFLVNRRGELDRQAAELEGRLHALALEGAEVEAFAAAIAAAIGAAVALEDEHGVALAVHAPAEAPGAAAAAAAYIARPRAAAHRIPLPGEGGALVVLGDRSVGEAALESCRRVAPFLALELGREAAVRRARDLERRGEVLPAAGPPWVVVLARQGSGDERDTIARREELRTRIRRLAPGRRVVLRGDARSVELRAVVATGPDDPDGLILAGRIGGLLERTVAVSEPFSDAAGRPPAESDARSALEAADGLPEPVDIARADRIAAYRLLGAVHNAPDGLRHARALVAAASRRGRSDDTKTLATLRACLDHPSSAEAAAALGVHRNTVMYRIRAIEERTGWDLADPDLRLALSVAVRIVQSAQR